MKCKIRGIQSINRTKPDGTTSVGIQLYLSNPDRKVVGEVTRSEYVRGDSDAYMVLRPFLANGIERLIGAECIIDFDVKEFGRGAERQMYKDVVGIEILTDNKK